VRLLLETTINPERRKTDGTFGVHPFQRNGSCLNLFPYHI
jgi:hypothetical protein